MATTSHNPFMDFTKIAGQFKMPNFNADALIEAQRKNIEAVTAANRIALEGAQALTQRQVEIVRQAWDESASVLESLTAAGKPEEKLAKQAELAKQALEQGLANLRELSEMGVQVQQRGGRVDQPARRRKLRRGEGRDRQAEPHQEVS